MNCHIYIPKLITAKLCICLLYTSVAIPANIRHTSLSAEGIGEGLKTKINVNLGISGDCIDYTNEMNKVKLAIDFGAEAIMDLSNYGKTHDFRKELIAYSPAMIGTVPMYDAIGYLEKDLMDIKAKDFLKVVQAHAEEGVDFMTIHAVSYTHLDVYKRQVQHLWYCHLVHRCLGHCGFLP